MTDRDPLERLLEHDARVLIDDDGFTARVMQALPARAARPRMWLTPALVLGSAALGSALAWTFAPDGVNAMQGFIDLASLHRLTPSAIASLSLGGALLLCAIVLAATTD